MKIAHSLLTCFLCLVLGLDVAQGAVVCFDARGHLAIELGHCTEGPEGFAGQEGGQGCAGAGTFCASKSEDGCVNVSISAEGLSRRAFDDLPSLTSPPDAVGHLSFDPLRTSTPRAAYGRTSFEGRAVPASLRSLRSIVLLI